MICLHELLANWRIANNVCLTFGSFLAWGLAPFSPLSRSIHRDAHLRPDLTAPVMERILFDPGEPYP